MGSALDKYIIIAGECQFRAAPLSGLRSLQCSIADENISEDEVLVAQIIKNAICEDFLATKRAQVYRDLMRPIAPSRQENNAEMVANLESSGPGDAYHQAVNGRLCRLQPPARFPLAT